MKTQINQIAMPALAVLICFALCVSQVSAQGRGNVRRIVVFQDSFVNAPDQEKLVKKFGGVVIKPLLLVNGMAVSLPPQAEKALLRFSADIARIDIDAEVYALPKGGKPDGDNLGKPPKDDPAQVLPWGVDRIDAEFAWPVSTGVGVNVAVLDTGIDYTHPDLDVAGGINIISDRKDHKDDNGHGTHVAGTIAALDNGIGVVGVAPGASLYAVKVLDRRGRGYISDIIAGLDWCVLNGIDIVNMSLGSDYDVLAMKDACDAASGAGVILVAAAGNDGAAVDYPAAYDSVIAVGATDSADATPWWSSRGPEVALAAPGVGILSTWKGGGYRVANGTSMACPHVAGSLALNLGGDVFGAADDIGEAGVDDLTGAGLVDAEELATGAETGDDLP